MSKSFYSPFPLKEVSDLLDPHPDREPGYHVTDLIWTARSFTKDKGQKDFKENNLMFWGRIWEAVVRPWTQAYVNKLGMEAEFGLVLEKDGILGSLDGKCGFPGGPTFAILEMKATTTRDPDPTKNFLRDHQARAYCYMENTNLAWFPLLHATSRPPDFQPYFYQIEYHDRELEDTWRMITRTRDYLDAIKE